MFSDCGDMLILKVGVEQARLACSRKAIVAIVSSAGAAAAAGWGILWAIRRHEIVLIASLLLAGGAIAAYALTSLWIMLRRRDTRVDLAAKTITPARGVAINFADIPHVELRVEVRDFYGLEVTSYVLKLVPIKGDGIRMAGGDGPEHLREIGSQIAQLIGRPLRDVTEEIIRRFHRLRRKTKACCRFLICEICVICG